MSLKSKLRRLELLTEYANKLITIHGLKEQKRLGKLDYNKDDSYFKDLLKVHGVYPDFDGVKGVSICNRASLYKRFGVRVEYITLLDPHEDDYTYPDYDWYENKFDIDNCKGIQSLKRKVRRMINCPDDYFYTSY